MGKGFLVAAIGILGGVLTAGAVTLSAGNAEFETGATTSARDIAIKRLQTETVQKGLAAGTLEKAMLADPARYARTNEAVRLCRNVYAEALTQQYWTAAEAIVRQLGLGEVPTNGLPEAVAAAVVQRFEATYESERAAAVAAQARTIAGAVRPTEEDFEKKDETTLRREMTAKVVAGQKTPVFEENLGYISEKIVDPVLTDGHRELERQRQYLSRTKCESYAPDAMKRELEANLRKNVAERRTKERDPAKAWGVFPGVLSETLPKVAERRAVSLVSKEVDDVAFAVDEVFVGKTIAADPETHRKASDSEKVFRRVYATQLTDAAIAKAAADAPAAQRDAFVSFARAHLAAPELTKSVESRLKRDILPKWRKTRAEVARAEADRLWPTLADRTWFPEADLADRMAARSDYAAAVRDWRKEPELSSLAKPDGKGPRLEETAANADRSVSAAFDLARNAIAAQNAVVTEVEPSVLAEALDRKSSFWRRTPDLKALVGLLTDAVTAKWNADRVSTLWPQESSRPANADDQHAELFPSVRKRIELEARVILEKMDESEKDAEEAEEPKPTPPDPSEEQPPTGFSILVESTGGRVSVKLQEGGKTVAERESEAKMSDYRSAMKFISDKLGTDILKLK